MNAKKALEREVAALVDKAHRLGLVDEVSPVTTMKKSLPHMSLVVLANWHTTLTDAIRKGMKIQIRAN
jgi:hypothetical protein